MNFGDVMATAHHPPYLFPRPFGNRVTWVHLRFPLYRTGHSHAPSTHTLTAPHSRDAVHRFLGGGSCPAPAAAAPGPGPGPASSPG